MEIDAQKLLEILKEEKALIEEMLELGTQQTETLKKDDLDKISMITAKHEHMEGQLALLEEKRRTVLEEYSQRVGTDIRYFSEVLTCTANTDRKELQEFRDEIINKYEQLKEVNELNSFLLQQSLVYVEKVLGILNSKKTCIYGKSGDMQRVDNQGIVDKSV